MCSRKLKDLSGPMQSLMGTFLGLCKSAGLDILVTCTYRSNFEQEQLYAQGRTAPGPIVTDARAGQSEHNLTNNGAPASAGCDIVPLDSQKRPVWDTSSPLWAKVASIWQASFGPSGATVDGYYLDWYGREGAPFLEFPHFCQKLTPEFKK